MIPNKLEFHDIACLLKDFHSLVIGEAIQALPINLD
jgi:hypothetical protein